MKDNNFLQFKKNILIVFGTRPEAIKFAPLIKKIQNDNEFDLKVCTTSQHKEMLHQVLSFFDIKVDFDLEVMRQNQDLNTLTSDIIILMSSLLKKIKPDMIIVQGDTTTAFASSLAAFYEKIPVAHLEAGLRSSNIYSPFPEEVNRKLIASIATLHFAPTIYAEENLKRENIKQHVYVTGNSVIDALYMGIQKLQNSNTDFKKIFPFYDPSKRMILVTGHRRESFGNGFIQICQAIINISSLFQNIQIIYPVHLNPNVQNPVRKMLKGLSNVYLIDPVEYEQMIWLIRHSHIILTDSGGIQEEAPSLGKPVVVMRDTTERVEGIEAGTAILAGIDTDKIVKITFDLLTNDEFYNSMSKGANPYGDGNTSEKVLNILKNYFHNEL